jgi:predicted amidohydrolase
MQIDAKRLVARLYVKRAGSVPRVRDGHGHACRRLAAGRHPACIETSRTPAHCAMCNGRSRIDVSRRRACADAAPATRSENPGDRPGEKKRMIIAVLQMQPCPAAPDPNLARIRAAATAASAFGARLLVTPELSLTGYAIGDDLAALAEPADGPLVTQLQAVARDTGLHLVAGFPELDGTTVYNSVVLAHAGGISVYRKCHLFGPGERAHFAPSSQPCTLVDIAGLRTGLLICYDIEFPEMARGLALAGAELIVVPTALPASPGQQRVSEVLVPSRALENHVFVAYAGLCGTERGMQHAGCSVIVGPDGADLARAGSGEALLMARIDPAARAAAHRENPYLDDRRPDLYAC